MKPTRAVSYVPMRPPSRAYGPGRPSLRVLDEAAGDPELAVLRADLAEQRLHGLTSFATLLAERGALKADLTIDKPAT